MTRGLRNHWCSGWLGFTLNLVRLVLGNQQTSFRLLKTISARNELNHPTHTISNQLRHSTINRLYSSTMNRLRRSIRHSELAQGIFQNCRRTGTVYSGSVGNPVPYNEELSLHQDKS